MPKIEKVFSLEITPERFLNACSDLELQELQMLLDSPRYQNKINNLLSVKTGLLPGKKDKPKGGSNDNV